MLSIHGVNAIKVKAFGANWIELTFKSKFEGDTTICIYLSSGGEEEWEKDFTEALNKAIEGLPPAPCLTQAGADE